MISVSKIRAIVVTAALGALTVLMGITGIGMIPFNMVSFTIMHIPVIIGAILFGPWSGAGVGFIMGVYSCVRASMAPAGPLDPFFANPLISIVPRVLFGVVSWAVYAGIKRCFSKGKGKGEYPAIVASAFLGTLLHTAFVMCALLIIKALDLKIALAVTVTNGIPEAIIAVVIVVSVVAAWRGIAGRQQRSSLAAVEDSITGGADTSPEDKPADR